MEPDDPLADDEPCSRLLPPDDRLWRHPSEVGAEGLPGRRPGRTHHTTLWLVALLASLAGGALAVGLMAATGNMRRVLRVPVVERVALPAGLLSAREGTTPPEMAEVSRRVGRSIVQLEVEMAGSATPVHGAGVVFRSDGHVLTNHHVVDGATRIVLVMADGRRSEGKLVGADPWSDLAVVKMDEGTSVPVATMGSASGLAVGQKVMVLAPTGVKEEPSASVGVVGALGRQLDRAGAPALLDMIQTSAPVARSWSGGALVDDTGAVVGITTALMPAGDDGASGTSFATPIDWARAVADQLVTTGRVVRVWMGVEGSDLDLDMARTLGVGGGAVVKQVREASPAADAGLELDDVVTSVDGEPVASMGALRVLLRARRPGDVVTLAVMRGAGTRSLEVRLAERPTQT